MNWCYLCEGSGESVDHLLFHCPIVTKLWSVVFILFGIHWVMPRTVVDQLLVGKESSGVIIMRLFGRLSLIVRCGVFDGKGTTGALRI